MLNSDLLKIRLKASGVTISYLAEILNLSRATVYNKIEGRSPFTTREAQTLTDVMHLSFNDRENIFFAQKVDKMPTRDTAGGSK